MSHYQIVTRLRSLPPEKTTARLGESVSTARWRMALLWGLRSALGPVRFLRVLGISLFSLAGLLSTLFAHVLRRRWRGWMLASFRFRFLFARTVPLFVRLANVALRPSLRLSSWW